MRNVMMPLLLLCFCSPLLAQESTSGQPSYLHTGKVGIGVDGLTGSPNLLVKYFANNQLALQLIAGMELYQPGGSAQAGTTKVTGVTLRGGLSVLFHLSQQQLSPFVGVEGVFQYEKAAGFYATPPDPKNSIAGSVLFGAEYFVTERFSAGIRQSIGVDVRLKRDVPKEETDITLQTSTMLSGRFYFN